MNIEGEVFIGSLTHLSDKEKQEVLEKASKNKKLSKMKISISPKKINKQFLKMIKKYNISTVELEVQSTNEYVLNKCGYKHNYEDVKKATKRLKWKRYKVSYQVGIGLPDSTKSDEIDTAEKLAKLKPNSVRIYPMVVMKNTELEKNYQNEQYEPLTLNQAVERCKNVVYGLNKKHIKQISIVKQNELNESEENEIIAGPYHKEFGQLVTDSIWYDSIVEKIKQFNVKVKTVKIEVNPKELPNILGYENENAKRLKEFYEVDIKAEGNPEIKIGKSKMEILEVYNN